MSRRPLAQSWNWRSEDGLWPYHETWMEWKRAEWQRDRVALQLKLSDMLETCHWFDTTTDGVEGTDGRLNVVVVIANIEKGRSNG
jgi:hypothetical protein